MASDNPPSIPQVAPLRLLISARDPAAAFHMAVIGQQAAQDPRFDLAVVAQEPAATLLHASGLPVMKLPSHLSRQAGADDAALLALADTVLASHRPDVVLCGLSSPGEAGIDEALVARRQQTPAALVQDFWGEQNRLFDRSPDLALVLDETARQLTLTRHGTPAQVTGSARHAPYASINGDATRAAWRAAHQIGNGAPVWGWFGQPLQAFEGYRRTLSAWTESLAALQTNATVVYRPHPRETAAQKEWTRSHLTDAGNCVVTAEACSTEDALLACDTACTILSNCAYDAAYLNFFSHGPLVAPMLLLFDEELRDFYQRTVDIRCLPYVEKGLTLSVWDKGALPEALRQALQSDVRNALWRAARAMLADPTQAVTRVLDAVWDLGRKARQVPSGKPGNPA